ncbi:predicted protein [Histoplasma capsulatum G186AR]|uniref:Uncharacterized protein n=1 Tax=Ajellomyces capsulatus (strain G186AR / H82 / ATCC MYA-2454 / RMSCC 2432) TaxID=447093 RepID=C0NXH9_AJECG|nr:uncharacterized protein HCBG_08171 [Histoplasma capsulatum G186AR]EEH04045.1 predicted protein [Histoplasma capsulatum G186AR]
MFWPPLLVKFCSEELTIAIHNQRVERHSPRSEDYAITPNSYSTTRAKELNHQKRHGGIEGTNHRIQSLQQQLINVTFAVIYLVRQTVNGVQQRAGSVETVQLRPVFELTVRLGQALSSGIREQLVDYGVVSSPWTGDIIPKRYASHTHWSPVRPVDVPRGQILAGMKMEVIYISTIIPFGSITSPPYRTLLCIVVKAPTGWLPNGENDKEGGRQRKVSVYLSGQEIAEPMVWSSPPVPRACFASFSSFFYIRPVSAERPAPCI